MDLLRTKKWVVVFLVMTMTTLCSMAQDDFHSLLGKAIYIPEEDLLGSIPNGITLFDKIPKSCLRKVNTATTVKDQSFYKNTAQFYKSIATETNINAKYEGSFSLGLTLDVTTKHVSGRNRSVTGTSLNLATKSYELQFAPNCLYETSLRKRVIDDFSRLDTIVSKPWYKVSWRKYQTFLQTHGSHIITGVTYGSSMKQYAFAEEKHSYSARDLTVKACASFALGVVSVNSVGISACSGVSKQEINSLSNKKMTSSITIRGGTPDTRNQLSYQRSNELMLKFLNEGQTNPTPIEFTLTPIWQILQRQRPLTEVNPNTYLQAINLQAYFDGYLNFGCPHIPASRGPELQKFDLAAHSTPERPVYECTIAPPGCHHKDDCHYHIGVWCACRGQSCIRHSETKLMNGGKRKMAAPYWGQDWGWQGCGWELWGSRCACLKESKTRVSIFR